MIVFDDADVEAVVEGVQDIRLLQCRAGLHGRMPRLCRQEGLRQTRRRPFRAPSRTIKYNLPNDDENEIGPLISQARGLVSLDSSTAREEKHISVAAGGKSAGGKGFFYEPTVVAGAMQSDEIVRKRSVRPRRVGRRGSTTSIRRWLG